VIAIFCGCLATGRQPTIFGDGKQTRDYVYVGDVVGANLLAVTSDASGPINIGTSRETSVLELVGVLGELAGVDDFTANFAPPRLGELARSCLDVGRARELLGWEPAVTIRDGLRMTLDASQATLQQ
jgi:UDP-glucose 4-epimerase